MTYVADARYDSMEYRRCGRSGLKLPAISLGLWHNFGDDRSWSTQRDICRMTSLVIGASSVKQLEDNVGALANTVLSAEELAEIEHYATDADINLWKQSSEG
jgi:aryl-alcohol dehydrogenase-like predicted oxidoreductase